MSMFDVLITITHKDFNKLPFVLESIFTNIKGVHRYHIISPMAIPDEYIFLEADLHSDNEVINFDFSKILMTSRQGWYRQQFLKLFQEVTTDNYLVVDGDILINKPIKIVDSHPAFFIGRDQLHQPYFDLLKRLFNLDRTYPHSFISEMMLFKRSVIKQMLEEYQMSKEEFFNQCVEEINRVNNPSGFSEYELYGNYVAKNFPDLYSYQPINVCHKWKRRRWTVDEIKNYARVYQRSNYNILTMHSWL